MVAPLPLSSGAATLLGTVIVGLASIYIAYNIPLGPDVDGKPDVTLVERIIRGTGAEDMDLWKFRDVNHVPFHTFFFALGTSPHVALGECAPARLRPNRFLLLASIN
jgi:hypothetical protein